MRAVWDGFNEIDGFNALVLGGRPDLAPGHGAAGLREVHAAGQLAVRARLHRGRAAQQRRHHPAAGAAVRGEVRPRARRADAEAAATACEDLEARIDRALDDVASLDHDRILRSYLTHIRATLRTNYFQPDAATGDRRPYISFKLEPSSIPDLPEPRPRFEIFVYSPRVEGVHLRFGAVARGGLRWSDRRDDFRTEVLGLVKAQMVKNTVIVPVGAKGGFFCKQLPRPQPSDRDAWLAEGIACYKTFICGLLDITDNLVDGETVPPRRRGAPRRRRLLPGRGRRQGHRDVLRHRQRRLARTTASGSATPSPAAARWATTTRRWASPPAARGSRCSGTSARWASTARPRTSPASASATCPVTSSATGCCAPSTPGWWRPSTTATSSSTRPRPGRVVRRAPAALRAAAVELAGLRRLADLRGRRRLPARASRRSRSPTPVRAALGHRRRRRDDDAGRADEGDPAGAGRPALERRHRHLRQGRERDPRRRRRQGQRRDPDRRPRAAGQVRRRGRQPRPHHARPDRVRPARRSRGQPGRINTDFIDNSAGVDTSDHEVNIKILLDRVVADGDLTEKQRNTPAGRDDRRGRRSWCCSDNYEQNLALANAAHNKRTLLHVQETWMKQPRGRRRAQPGAGGAAVQPRGTPPARPQRGADPAGGRGADGVTKIVLAEELLASDLPDDPYLDLDLKAYFPTQIREGFEPQIDRPPAAPRDHRDPGGQRPRQRRRHDLLAAAGRRDRGRRRPS